MENNFNSLGCSVDRAPQMPVCVPSLVELLTRNVPKSCRPAVACSVFPALATHLHGVKLMLRIDYWLHSA